MPREPGTITHGSRDVLHVTVANETYQISPADQRDLLFYGRVVPVTKVSRTLREDGTEVVSTSIEGHAAINIGGKAVLLHTRAGSYIIPFISFQRVVRGEAVSAPLFPLLPECPGGHA